MATRYRDTQERSVLAVTTSRSSGSRGSGLYKCGPGVTTARGWRWERTGEEGLREDRLDLVGETGKSPGASGFLAALVGVGLELPRKWLLIFITWAECIRGRYVSESVLRQHREQVPKTL